MEQSKIYVVITVLAMVFTGLAGYLISIDRKIRKIEGRIEDKSKS